MKSKERSASLPTTWKPGLIERYSKIIRAADEKTIKLIQNVVRAVEESASNGHPRHKNHTRQWSERLGWAAVIITALLADRASSWPYGVIMSLKAIF
jgi:uncharacterized protein YwbE